jgi:hypothetical protein
MSDFGDKDDGFSALLKERERKWTTERALNVSQELYCTETTSVSLVQTQDGAVLTPFACSRRGI